jgi:DNA-binding transcriptional LysR family regulator
VPQESPRPAREQSQPPLKIAYVPGVTPGKWISRWAERQHRGLTAEQVEDADILARLGDASADLVFIRIPEEGFQRPKDLHAIPLYREQPVVAAPKDHPVAAFDEVTLADLDGENIMDAAQLGGAAMGLEIVASGAGLLILPMSIARIHSRRDIICRPVHDVEGTRIAVAWRQDAEDPDIEEFVGIVRGRTANSSRQPSAAAEPAKGRKAKAGAGQQSGKPQAAQPRSGTGKASGGRKTQNRPAGGTGGRPARRRPGKGRG